MGITSACAEQTNAAANGQLADSGSPPRVRSRQVPGLRLLVPDGITSACAEQTDSISYWQRVYGDHLRVCGADNPQPNVNPYEQGSPPRVRSRQIISTSSSLQTGITSACAEQT